MLTGYGKAPTDLRQAANELVNQMFYGTLMKEFRQGQSNPYFGNEPGGQIFQEQLDAELVRHIHQDRPGPLADSLIRALDPHGRYHRPGDVI